MNVGDLTSDAKGSGARFNAGKPPVDLIPLILIAEGYGYVRGIGTASHIANSGAVTALGELGMFQCGADIASLHNAFAALGMPWMECANVFDFGRKKYKAWNWAKGMPWSVPLACAARHLIEMIEGGTDDHDSHLPIVGHVACNLVMLMTFMTTYTEGDDRPVATLAALAAPSEVVEPAPAPFKIDGLGDYVMRNGAVAELDYDATHAFGGSHPRDGLSGRYRASWHKSGTYLGTDATPAGQRQYDIVRKVVADNPHPAPSIYGPFAVTPFRIDVAGYYRMRNGRYACLHAAPNIGPYCEGRYQADLSLTKAGRWTYGGRFLTADQTIPFPGNESPYDIVAFLSLSEPAG